jgi:hypothetical protein
MEKGVQIQYTGVSETCRHPFAKARRPALLSTKKVAVRASKHLFSGVNSAVHPESQLCTRRQVGKWRETTILRADYISKLIKNRTLGPVTVNYRASIYTVCTPPRQFRLLALLIKPPTNTNLDYLA